VPLAACSADDVVDLELGVTDDGLMLLLCAGALENGFSPRLRAAVAVTVAPASIGW
jgi:hypothetical protein